MERESVGERDGEGAVLEGAVAGYGFQGRGGGGGSFGGGGGRRGIVQTFCND